jgi:alkylation response protein AidB-like acyl-CoA dehydrogenase
MSGRNRRGRDAMGVGLAALNRLAGVQLIDRLKLRKPIERAVFEGSKAGFRTVGAANRTFAAAKQRNHPERPGRAPARDLFDLTPTDEQLMIAEATRKFAAEQLRPAAASADADCAVPDTIVKRSVTELGVTLVGIPETLGGMGAERSATTGALVAEALAHGDMGLAVACLAPAAVSSALVLWGDAQQQATYLPAFTGDDVPAAALAVLEPRPLFDPFQLGTTAQRTPGGYKLNGVKALVPRAANAELFIVAASLEGAPALFILESGTSGVVIEGEPGMGLRAASTAPHGIEDGVVPEGALLQDG